MYKEGEKRGEEKSWVLVRAMLWQCDERLYHVSRHVPGRRMSSHSKALALHSSKHSIPLHSPSHL